MFQWGVRADKQNRDVIIIAKDTKCYGEKKASGVRGWEMAGVRASRQFQTRWSERPGMLTSYRRLKEGGAGHEPHEGRVFQEQEKQVSWGSLGQE